MVGDCVVCKGDFFLQGGRERLMKGMKKGPVIQNRGYGESGKEEEEKLKKLYTPRMVPSMTALQMNGGAGEPTLACLPLGGIDVGDDGGKHREKSTPTTSRIYLRALEDLSITDEPRGTPLTFYNFQISARQYSRTKHYHRVVSAVLFSTETTSPSISSKSMIVAKTKYPQKRLTLDPVKRFP